MQSVLITTEVVNLQPIIIGIIDSLFTSSVVDRVSKFWLDQPKVSCLGTEAYSKYNQTQW